MKKPLFALCLCILLFVSCSKKPIVSENKTTRYIEDCITDLKEIEIPPTARFNAFLAAMEDMNTMAQNSNEPIDDSLLLEFRDIISETIKVNKTAAAEFRALALKDKPDYVEDTIYILLRTATAVLGQSYEIRHEAMASFYRYFSLGTMRFFYEYSEKMSQAMENSRQAFFFLTMARMRQKIIIGDTLDTSLQEFFNIPELPQYEELLTPPDSADIGDTLELSAQPKPAALPDAADVADSDKNSVQVAKSDAPPDSASVKGGAAANGGKNSAQTAEEAE